jgi:hypothetical protein
MKDRLARFAPLISGVLFVAFVVINNAQTGSTPDNSATGETVLAYYKTHGDKMGGAGFSLALSVVAGLFFYGILRSYLRTSKRAEWASAIGFGGAIIFAAGALAEAGIDFTISDVKNNISAPAAQTLNILQGDLGAFFIQAGLCALMLGFGIAMLRSRTFSRWLGWATIVIGVFAIAGPLIGLAFPLEGLWVLYVSVLLFMGNAIVSPAPDSPETNQRVAAA